MQTIGYSQPKKTMASPRESDKVKPLIFYDTATQKTGKKTCDGMIKIFGVGMKFGGNNRKKTDYAHIIG